MHPVGTLVEYLDKGRFLCAAVLEDTGKRLRLLNQNGRETTLPENRIVSAGARPVCHGLNRQQTIDLLTRSAHVREELKQSLQMEIVWDVAVEEEEQSFPPDFLTELYFGGTVTDDHVAAFIRGVFEDRLFFKFKNDVIVAHPRETVAQLQAREKKEKEKNEYLDKNGQQLLLLMSEHVPDAHAWPEKERVLHMLREFYLFGNDAEQSELTRELLQHAGLTRPHDPFHLLVKAGIWDKNENIFLYRQEFPSSFSKEARMLAKEYRDRNHELAPHCRDLRHLELITIDAETTRDCDDALHVAEKNGLIELGIHIADVSFFVLPGDVLFREAQQRGTSLYLPDRQLPMLPEALSTEAASLLAGKDRRAVSILVQLLPDGTVKDVDLFCSLVNVRRRLSYHEADKEIRQQGALAVMFQAAGRQRDKRLEQGALLLPFPDRIISITANKKIEIRLEDAHTSARILVAESMILANRLIAQYMADRQIPCLFRSQGPPHKRVAHGHSQDLFANSLQRKFLARGQLSPQALHHAGLGVSCYTTATSPIRRLLDLVVQQQLTACLAGKGPLYTEKEMREMGGVINETLSRANSVRQMRERYWMLKYFEPRVGTRMNAMVIQRRPRQISLLLTDFLLPFEMPAAGAPKLDAGDRIQLTLTRADALDNVLRLDW